MAAKKKQNREGFSGETTIVTLFYDGDRYKDPVFVGINGKTWLVKRGEPVEVPVEVAAVLRHSVQQDGKTAQMIADLSKAAKELEL